MTMRRSHLAAAAVVLGAFVAAERAEAAATLYTTLHSATYSVNYTHVSGPGTLSLAYNGPDTNNLSNRSYFTGNNAPGPYEAGFLIEDRFSMYSFQSMDAVGFKIRNTDPAMGWASYTSTISWDVTFATAVVLDSTFNLAPVQTWTVTDSNGTIPAMFEANGTALQAGRYTISVTSSRNQTTAVEEVWFLALSTASPVPGSGLAAIGSLGLAGLARRRRR